MSGRRLQAEEILEQTQFDFENENDPENILYKSTTVAKYLTLDIILENKYGLTEA